MPFALMRTLKCTAVAFTLLWLAGTAAASCPNFCRCKLKAPNGKSYTVCWEGLATNPPKKAVQLSPLHLYAPALEIELLSLRGKRCKSIRGVAADCVRQALQKQQRYTFTPKLVAGSCKCPSTAQLCQTLPKLRTSALGSYVPPAVYKMLSCANEPPASNRPTLSGTYGDAFCDPYADALNKILSAVLTKVWPSVQSSLPPKIDTSSSLTKDFSTWIPPMGKGTAKVTLNSISGLNALGKPTLSIVQIPSCNDLSSVTASLQLKASLSSLTVSGSAKAGYTELWFTPSWISATADISIALQDLKLTLTASANAGLTGNILKGYQGCAAISEFSAVSFTVGSSKVDVSTWIGGVIPVGLFTNWIIEDIVEALLPTVINSWAPDLIKDALNSDSVVGQMAGCVSMNPLGICTDRHCEACFVESSRCDKCKDSPPSVLVQGKCVLCPTGCAACQAPSSNGTMACSSCQDGYYLHGQTCTKCPKGCSECTVHDTWTECTACEEDYTLWGGSCPYCKDAMAIGCARCESYDWCGECAPGYRMYNPEPGTKYCVPA